MEERPCPDEHKPLSAHALNRFQAEVPQNTLASPPTRRGLHGAAGPEELLLCMTSKNELRVPLPLAVVSAEGSLTVSVLTNTT